MITCHHLKIKTCLNELKTEATGLTWEEAEKRLNKYGFNELAKEMPVSRFNVFISQFKNPLAYVLVIAGTLSVVLGSYIDSAVIFGAVILNSIIGFIQENKANQAIAKLKNLVEHKAVVLRDGRDITINSRRVTIGDIVLIKAGNKKTLVIAVTGYDSEEIKRKIIAAGADAYYAKPFKFEDLVECIESWPS